MVIYQPAQTKGAKVESHRRAKSAGRCSGRRAKGVEEKRKRGESRVSGYIVESVRSKPFCGKSEIAKSNPWQDVTP